MVPRARRPTPRLALLFALALAGCTEEPAPITSSPPTETVSPPAIDGTQDLIVAAAGDIASPGSPDDEELATGDLIASWNPDAVLTLGDNQYPDGELSDYQTSYDQAWGAFKDITYPSPGNHDEHSELAGYCAYFGSDAHCPAAYYSFDLGSWHLVSLDSSSGEISEEQLAWLRNDLAADTEHRCELVYWHHPRWSSGSEHGSDEEMDALWATVVEAGADLVLNGHEHNYERFTLMGADGAPHPQGTRQIVAGSGGAGLYEFGEPLETSKVRISAHGALRLALSPTAYAWEWFDVTGARRDAGSTTCH